MEPLIKIQDWLNDQSPNLEKEKRLFLTEKQIRSHPTFTNASDEEVINIINSLHQLALISYEIVSKELNDKLGILQKAA
ncbi:MAG TPA: hypothetical protein VGQ09_05850 [Chitinophagaceae bacterium]|jgi:hypothetical protein|nr:hypothetical protein [Chitinophagaceae bacterium]